MSDGVVLVPATRADQHYDQVQSLQAMKAAVSRRWARVATGMAGAFFCLAVAEGAAICSILPTVRVVPVFVRLNSDGTADTSQSLAILPKSERVAQIEALLWQYVRHRERYTAPDAKEDFTIVTAMSSAPVAEQYAKWFNGDNPESPQVRLGKEGFILVDRISAAFAEHTPDYSGGRYEVRFRRTITGKDGRARSQRMIVSFSYATVDNLPMWQRVTINPGGVIVTEYRGAEVEGAP